MRLALAVVLVIGGVFLVALPPLSDYLWRADAMRLMERGANNVNLGGKMQDPYAAFCYMAGVAMIALAIWYSTRRPPSPGGVSPPKTA